MENPFGFWIRRGECISVAPSARPHFGFKNWFRFFAVCIIQSSNVFWKQPWYRLIARAERVVAWNCLVRSYRSATASQSLGNPERKTLLAFLIWRGWNFFWKRKGCFSFGVLPSKYSGRWRNNADEVLAKLFFWGKDLPKLRLICFWIRMSQAEEEGSGEESSACSSFCFGEIRAGVDTKSKNIFDIFHKICYNYVSWDICHIF